MEKLKMKYKRKIQKHSLLGIIMAGTLITTYLPLKQVKAAEKIIYVSGCGSAQNSGLDRTSPLNSLKSAQQMLSDGGVIVVTETFRISSGRICSLDSGLVVKADESLKGAIFVVEKGAELTLNNVVIIGRNSTLINNHGILNIDEGVTLKVLDAPISISNAVSTDREAATCEDEIIVEGISKEKIQVESETLENSEDGAGVQSTEVSELETDAKEGEQQESKIDTEEKKEEEAEAEVLEGEKGTGEEKEDVSEREEASVSKEGTREENGKETELIRMIALQYQISTRAVQESGNEQSGTDQEEPQEAASIAANDMQLQSVAGSTVITGLGVSAPADNNSTASVAGNTVIVGIGVTPSNNNSDNSSSGGAAGSSSSSGNNTGTNEGSESTNEGNANTNKSNTNNVSSTAANTGDQTKWLPLILSLFSSIFILIGTVFKKKKE